MKVDILGVKQYYPFGSGVTENQLVVRLPSGREISLSASDETIIMVTREFVGISKAEAVDPPVDLMPMIVQEGGDTSVPMGLPMQPLRLDDDPPEEFGGVREVIEDEEGPVLKQSAPAPYTFASTTGHPAVRASMPDPGELPVDDEEGVGSI